MTVAPWGFNNDATKESWQTSKLFWILCILPACCMHCCDSRSSECIYYHKDGDVAVKDLLKSSDNSQTCKTWGIRIYAFFLVEVGIVVALCLWMTWLYDIPMVKRLGTDISLFLMSTLLNLALCLITTGVQYAIWKYYLSLVLFSLALVLLFFTFFFGW